MTSAAWIAVLDTAVRALVAVFGFVLVIMGYRLYVSGLRDRSGEIEASWGDKRFVIKHAAPGTFLALVGGAAMLAAVFTGHILTRPHSHPSRDHTRR